MDWLKNLHPTTKLLLLSGAGISATCVCYSLYKHKYPLEHDTEVETFVLPKSPRKKESEGNVASRKPTDGNLTTPVIDRLNGPTDEMDSGWVTPTASNDNLVCRLVENSNEVFEEDSPRKQQPIEDDFIMDEFEVDRKASRKILILGLENSGKSALLSQLSKEGTDCSMYQPTKGFNVVCISFEKIDLNIWEIGGAIEYRSYWKNFSQSTDLILFAVDASDRSSFPMAKKYFNDIIGEANEQSDFHIIATKSDIEGSAEPDEIQNALGLDGMNLNVVNVAVRAGGASSNIGLESVQQCCLQDAQEETF